VDGLQKRLPLPENQAVNEKKRRLCSIQKVKCGGSVFDQI